MILMFSLVLLIRASGEMETEHTMSAVPTILASGTGSWKTIFTQAGEMLAMRSGHKYRWSFTGSPATYLLLWSPVPNSAPTCTCGSAVGDPCINVLPKSYLYIAGYSSIVTGPKIYPENSSSDTFLLLDFSLERFSLETCSRVLFPINKESS